MRADSNNAVHWEWNDGVLSTIVTPWNWIYVYDGEPTDCLGSPSGKENSGPQVLTFAVDPKIWARVSVIN